MRTIVKAAIRVKDKIYTGFDHGECFNCAEFPIPVEDLEQGFITSEGDFVDRKEAMVIAKEAGQLRYETDKQTLISEDLHIDWLHKQENKITELEKEIEKYKQLCTISKLEDLQIENMLLKGKHQEKISFCIEKLEQLKEKVSESIDQRNDDRFLWMGYLDEITHEKLDELIDNQIKELKDMK